MKQVSLRAINMPSPPIADTRLSGTRLIIARSVWIVLMLLSCGLYLAAALVYYVQLHGFQEGVYAHLISTPAVVSGYNAFESSSVLFTGPYTTLNITLITLPPSPLHGDRSPDKQLDEPLPPGGSSARTEPHR